MKRREFLKGVGVASAAAAVPWALVGASDNPSTENPLRRVQVEVDGQWVGFEEYLTQADRLAEMKERLLWDILND